MRERLDWYGCYSEGWQGEIVGDAFSHPAKFARGLIRRIYEHAIRRGWLAEGDTVLDPFGGVALGGLDAMFHGLNWVGVELEEKFDSLGNQNIELWDRRYNNGMLPRWGTAVLLQGDSRRLCEVLDGARVQGVVASPPYVSGGHHNGVFNTWGGQLEGDKGCAGWATKEGGYGGGSANLGNMREGEFATVVSSPAMDAVISSPSFSPDQPCASQTRAKRDYHAFTRGDGTKRSHAMRSVGNLSLESPEGDTFWSAARLVVEQCHQVLVPGGVAIWVLKDYIRNKKRVPFCDQWRQMCEACGFETMEWIRAWLIEDRGAQYALNGDLVKKKVERKSFFRRLHERKYPHLSIDYEIVLCMKKAA